MSSKDFIMKALKATKSEEKVRSNKTDVEDNLLFYSCVTHSGHKKIMFRRKK